MIWLQLTEEEQLNAIIEQSKTQPVVIFKHSTTCSISAMAKMRLDKSETLNNVSFYYLDLLRYRSISNKIAELFGVKHESPQVLLIVDGECVYDESHNGITMDEIIDAVASQS